MDRIRSNLLKRRRRLFSEGTRNRKSKKKYLGAPDKDYGLAEPLIDILSDEELEKKKGDFITTLSQVNRIDIENETKDQCQNSRWYQERKIRITASKFGEICMMKPHTSCKKKVHQMLYKAPISTKEMAYGIENEEKV